MKLEEEEQIEDEITNQGNAICHECCQRTGLQGATLPFDGRSSDNWYGFTNACNRGFPELDFESDPRISTLLPKDWAS